MVGAETETPAAPASARVAPPPGGAFDALPPAIWEGILDCVHCGICLPQCPTYRILGQEMDTPRGRIYLMRAAAEGRIGLTPNFVAHMDRCLGCRACETACPAGVGYGQLIENARVAVENERAPRRTRIATWTRRWLLRLIADPVQLERAAGLMSLYERTGLRRLLH